jgi:hypothetical protein
VQAGDLSAGERVLSRSALVRNEGDRIGAGSSGATGRLRGSGTMAWEAARVAIRTSL